MFWIYFFGKSGGEFELALGGLGPDLGIRNVKTLFAYIILRKRKDAPEVAMRTLEILSPGISSKILPESRGKSLPESPGKSLAESPGKCPGIEQSVRPEALAAIPSPIRVNSQCQATTTQARALSSKQRRPWLAPADSG